ncbi:MAG TPA: NUDIX domain-containing protein [Candidatus Paceibacterota bacterium]|jgi:8-oxo-dGTP pyrophosphatase MutT (NUDIX family)|nr:NUDIX domain-containing protein [Candidatus Paceibacterota bacterium]
MEKPLDPRVHFVVATALVVRDGKFLITKRSTSEKVFPGKWTSPGGKVTREDYESLPWSAPSHPQWYNVMELALRREVREETGLEIEKPNYLTDLVFIRPDGYPVVTFSYWARYKRGEVKLNHEMTDFAWVTAEEAKKYDLIDGILNEIITVDEILS